MSVTVKHDFVSKYESQEVSHEGLAGMEGWSGCKCAALKSTGVPATASSLTPAPHMTKHSFTHMALSASPDCN